MMGSIRWTAAKLTMFTAVTVVVTMWLASLIGNFGLFSSPYEIKGEFADASGVLRGDVVKAAGVTIGRVEATEVENGTAVVTMSIDEEVRLPASLRAEIRFRNLVGQKMITLEQEGVTSAFLEAGATIPLEMTESAFDLGVLFNGLRPLIRSTNPHDINLVTQAITEALQGREEEVASLLRNITAITDSVASKDRQIGGVLDSVNVVAEDLNARDAQLQNSLADMEVLLTEISAGREDLAAAVNTLGDSASIFNRIVKENRGNIDQELRDLAVILEAVDDKKTDLRGAIRALPAFLVAAERATSYGQWTMVHVPHLCKDDLAKACGRRGVR